MHKAETNATSCSDLLGAHQTIASNQHAAKCMDIEVLTCQTQQAFSAGEQLRSALPRSSSGMEESPLPQDSSAEAEPADQPSVSTYHPQLPRVGLSLHDSILACSTGLHIAAR